MFGGGFLDAVNNLRIPRDFLDNMMTPPQPPRRYATGGYVDGPGAPMLPSASKSPRPYNGPPIIINMQDVSEDTLNRVVKPWFNKLTRASR